jgi:NAD(P)-dependent dehydrogenase (short-subunit alcohol dehydrogenase family)
VKVSELFDVRGKRVFITGSGSGIGLAIAEIMADAGARIMLIDRYGVALEAAMTKLKAADVDVHGEVADVTSASDLDSAVAATNAAFGGIDIVFANAGVSGGPGFLLGDHSRNEKAAIENLDPEFWDRVIAANLGSIFRTIRAVTPALKKQNGGRIIVTSSISASKTELHVGTAYVASKAAVAQLVRQTARELARWNILVNAIAPGPVVTNIAGGRLKQAEARAPFEAAAPLHRIATPEDIQGAALFLASPASRHMTGAELIIDGGAVLGPAD